MLNLEDIDNGTKERTLARVFVSIYAALAIWKLTYEIVFNATGVMWLAAAIATAVMIFGLAVDTITTYKNNDYTAAGQVGTDATHILKADPTAVVDIYDGDEDDDEPNIEELDPEDNADETIEEGDE